MPPKAAPQPCNAIPPGVPLEQFPVVGVREALGDLFGGSLKVGHAFVALRQGASRDEHAAQVAHGSVGAVLMECDVLNRAGNDDIAHASPVEFGE
ncbi:hypothetical protein BX281_0262 [Streptomyces sp. Ag82_O1-15]|nr:hypothetical protein BX281_0262 [Streptomyces sp. Ag82_O1-15]